LICSLLSESAIGWKPPTSVACQYYIVTFYHANVFTNEDVYVILTCDRHVHVKGLGGKDVYLQSGIITIILLILNYILNFRISKIMVIMTDCRYTFSRCNVAKRLTCTMSVTCQYNINVFVCKDVCVIKSDYVNYILNFKK